MFRFLQTKYCFFRSHIGQITSNVSAEQSFYLAHFSRCAIAHWARKKPPDWNVGFSFNLSFFVEKPKTMHEIMSEPLKGALSLSQTPKTGLEWQNFVRLAISKRVSTSPQLSGREKRDWMMKAFWHPKTLPSIIQRELDRIFRDWVRMSEMESVRVR